MDPAGVRRSLNTIRTEMEYLRDSGVLNPNAFNSIMAQLPQANEKGVQPSGYIDPTYGNGVPVTQIAQASQDPNHPANPQHPKHHEWAKNLASRLGNAAVFGAGATAGSDLVNSIF